MTIPQREMVPPTPHLTPRRRPATARGLSPTPRFGGNPRHWPGPARPLPRPAREAASAGQDVHCIPCIDPAASRPPSQQAENKRNDDERR
ncbi:hypothetical protein EGJ90_25310 [Pseudomonas aeruginosa]|nr:hypothetical protein EGJ62_19720 [Pseudomonas aeruginosa]RRW96810.1 hypothetical protein EGJ83_19320 [Pseudomonas aeruginosa]RRX09187.1 hypothetical protein EGK43_18100 [Pseudomonas aeruginosa]RRX15591.1 hypothetical protein EGJ74_20645 [Pseudomonas aeruginosa]RRX22215.1 hypothetical protein EGJ67_25200 [Pseudomonas aeruginosa]